MHSARHPTAPPGNPSAPRPRPASALTQPPLAEFVDLRQLLPAVQPALPTIDAVRWFIRHHREDLVTGGALINLAGRLRVHPGNFSALAVRIGARQALAEDRQEGER